MNTKYLLLSNILFFGLNAYGNSLQVASVESLLKSRPNIRYKKVHEPIEFDYQPFPLSENLSYQPNTGLLGETFVLTIPNGITYSYHGWVLAGNVAIKELCSQYIPSRQYLNFFKWSYKDARIKRIKGRVAVLATAFCDSYAHWMIETLGRLEILKQSGVEYDWLYVSLDKNKPYIRETLSLLGVDLNKVIEPFDENYCIQAEELIVPSRITYRVPRQGEQNFSHYTPLSMYCLGWGLDFLRNSFFSAVQGYQPTIELSEKVFVSRDKALHRKTLNEDKLFELFEKKGFKKYYLEDLSILDQVALFKQAKYIVSAHSAALVNIMFCNSGTKILEIFQSRPSSTYWYICQALNLDNYPVKTVEFEKNLFKGIFINSAVDLRVIEKSLDQFYP